MADNRRWDNTPNQNKYKYTALNTGPLAAPGPATPAPMSQADQQAAAQAQQTRNSNQQQAQQDAYLAQLRDPAYHQANKDSYARKFSDLKAFSPFSIATNIAAGKPAITPLSPEEQANRQYLAENPGQDTRFTSQIFGTGKWEPYHSKEVSHTQVSTPAQNGVGIYQPNSNGMGINNNVDRFGNQRTDMTPEVRAGLAAGNTYWNSSTGAWTDKNTGVPIGGKFNSKQAKDRYEANSNPEGGAKTNKDTGGSGGNNGGGK